MLNKKFSIHIGWIALIVVTFVISIICAIGIGGAATAAATPEGHVLVHVRKETVVKMIQDESDWIENPKSDVFVPFRFKK